ncbi:MAG: hypothetical protein EBX97_07440 [Actinobacteria bacterium]|jgi:hypothetical protein|nr:hypothetical protein [Actinomycetota bacterium]
MGRLSLDGFREVADDDTALRWHLQSNHYPPIPSVMIEPCKVAIANANAGEWHAEIQLPDGILWRGNTTCPTHALIEHAHLDGFLDDNE